MRVELGGEDVEGARHELHCAVGVVAGATAADLSAPAPDARSLVLAFESCGALEGAGDRREPAHARAALAGALAGEEARDVCGFDEPA